MRVLIATPLYPPEVADAAAYSKELARRLAKNHDVTVVAYAHMPEQVPGVSVIAVNKRQPRFARIRAFRRALAGALRKADVLIAINGTSIELPLLTLALPQTLLCLADKAADARGGFIERLASSRSHAVIREVPGPKPEILPLEVEPTEALAAWEKSWQAHLSLLASLLTHE